MCCATYYAILSHMLIINKLCAGLWSLCRRDEERSQKGDNNFIIFSNFC